MDPVQTGENNSPVSSATPAQPAAPAPASRDAEYEAEIARLRDESRKKDEALANLNVALRKERDTKDSEAAVEKKLADDPKSQVDAAKRELQEMLESRLTDFQVQVVANVFDEELSRLSASDKERELIKEHYRTSVRHSGFDRDALRRDLMLAKAAANLKYVRFDGAAPSSSEATNVMAGGGGKDSRAVSEDANALSDSDAAFMLKMGVDPKTRQLLK